MHKRIKQELIDGVAQEWKRVYQSLLTPERRSIGEKLAALPVGATEDQIRAIVGNSSWVMHTWLDNTCAVCAIDKVITIEIVKLDGDCCDHLIYVCSDCLQEALTL